MLKLKRRRAGNGSVISADRRLRLLEEKLQNSLLQTEGLTRMNKALEDQLRLTKLEGKLAGGMRCRVIVKVESA
jgi:hypothetical protein